MDCFELSSESAYELPLKAAILTPISHYFVGFLLLLSVFLYHFLEIHFIQDLFTGFRGQSVSLTYSSCCELYQEVVSKCKILNGRFASTPWLCSPHLQTVFLQLFGRAPVCNYRREIFHTSDGGTKALDWLRNEDVKEPSLEGFDGVQDDDKSPIMVVIPGLTSDSDSAYIKHLAFEMAHRGWNVVVSNHRGLGGVPLTSNCIFNGRWTEDVREVVDHLHNQYPQAPLFAVGTSVGANTLVKYLGEEGVNTAIVGAVAVCSPWDILLCDRFLHGKPVQRFYDRALATGLKDYAQLHQTTISRLADWESIAKSRSVRDFDRHATCVLAKFETVDTYYRKSSSASYSYIGNVMVPLLCISTLDDPVCTKEAIPWDECRANKNVVLATTQHGGHLAYFEAMTAKGLWWVRAVDEFLCTLRSSSLINREKMQKTIVDSPLEPSIDRAPCVNIKEASLVTGSQQNEQLDDKAGDDTSRGENGKVQQETTAPDQFDPAPEPKYGTMAVPVKNCSMNQLSRRS